VTDPNGNSYSMKEMLSQVDDRVRVGFERLDSKLDAKASQVQVDKIEVRVEAHEIALQRQDAAKAIMRASRFTVCSPSPDAGPSTGAVTEGIHHFRGTHKGSQAIIPPGRETRPWSST